MRCWWKGVLVILDDRFLIPNVKYRVGLAYHCQSIHRAKALLVTDKVNIFRLEQGTSYSFGSAVSAFQQHRQLSYLAQNNQSLIFAFGRCKPNQM